LADIFIDITESKLFSFSSKTLAALLLNEVIHE